MLTPYRSHKTVHAAKIVAMRADAAVTTAHLDNGEVMRFTASSEFAQRCRATPDDWGYVVKYPDGFISWSPSKAFEDGYRPVPTEGMTFGEAIEALRNGERVCRRGWNGKGMWLEMQRPDKHSKMTLPYLYLNYPEDSEHTPGARVPWLASQTDVLAQDWMLA